MKHRVSLVVLCALSVVSFLRIYSKAEVTAPPYPVSLTSPDGQAMNIEKYDLRVAVNGALSLTEMEITFRNPQDRQMEGRFLYLLPPGATISRFAKEVDGKLMEGEVVEKLYAQSVYTEILHTMRDPALLEMDQGNRFSARVFPIPAKGTVRLLLSFSKILQGERKLVIPMAGMPAIGEFNFNGHFEGEQTVRGVPGGEDGSKNQSRQFRNFAPVKDIELTFKPDDIEHHRALKAGNYQMLRFYPNLPWKDKATVPSDISLYFDTSASNADNESRRLIATEALLNTLVPMLRRDDRRFSAYAFDIDVKEILGATSMNARGGQPIMPQVVNKLRARHALGATNLAAVLKHIGENARSEKEAQRFVLVSDGIATLGPRDIRDVLAALGDWPENDALHVLVLGNKQDDKMLSAIVEKGRGRIITVQLNDQIEKEIPVAVGAIYKSLGYSYEAYDEGASWIYPRAFRDVHPGAELIVFSELKNGAASKPGFIERGPDGKVVKDEAVAIAAADTPDFAPLLQREAIHAQLDYMEKMEQQESSEPKRAESRAKRLELSVKNRVLCPLTSLLVLETENDYARFNIERTALAEIMQIGKNGIELRKRTAAEMPPPAKPIKAAKIAEKGDAPAKAAEELAKLADAKPEADAKDDPVGVGGGGGLDAAREGADAPHPFRSVNAFAAAPTSPPPPPAANPEARQVELHIADVRDLTQSIQGEPRNQAGQAPAESPARPAARAEAKIERPEWIKQSSMKTSEDELNVLRAKVQGSPRDRTLRNAYAAALAKLQRFDSLQGEAFEWLPFDPENPQVYEYLGISAAGLNDHELSLRAITSIADLAPNRASLLGRAGWLLLAAKKHEMAREMFTEALKNRKDDPNLYRGLSMCYPRTDEGAKVLEDALKIDFNERYGNVKQVLREELKFILIPQGKVKMTEEAWQRIVDRLKKSGVDLDRRDDLRVTLAWETDANDVDLHVVDPNGEECFYGHKSTKSGLELYSDQTQGLGPEVIRTGKAIPGTYHVGVKYFNAGPMGVSRGVVVIIRPMHKGSDLQERVIIPFCLIPDGPDMRELSTVEF